MKFLPCLVALTTAGAAQAHPGHLVDAAGHNHWVAGAAIGAAIAAGVWGMLKGRGKKSDTEGAGSKDRQEA